MRNLLKEHAEQINYIQKGEGPPVILVHGIAASLSDWEYLVPDLVRDGYQTLALDLLGHGDSLKPDDHNHYHSDSLYLHLVAWIEHLNLSQPPILVGHSLGGFLCMKYALERPEAIEKLVLIDPFFSQKQLPPLIRLVNRHPAWGEKALRLAPIRLIHALIGWDVDTSRNFSDRKRQQVAEDYKRASPKILHILNTVAGLSQHLTSLRKPTLVIWGERDKTLKPESFPHLVEQLPDAVGRPIASCGHQPHIGKPEIVNPIVLDFLHGNVISPSSSPVDDAILAG